MTADTILELARSQLGVKESPPNSNNVKYNTAYYGRGVSGDAYPWCCVFQWWLFHECAASELFYGGQKTASCTTLYNYYKTKGQLVDVADTQPGDLVFFTFNAKDKAKGIKNHIGICEANGDGYITTIDGNTGTTNEANGGAVMRKRRDWSYVTGVARPAYTAEKKEDEEGMKIYHWFADMPDWARPSAEKAYKKGIIEADADSGAVNVYEVNLQTIVWLDRLGLLD